jgi:polyisoprenoid-binding protein YceI
MTQPSVPAGTWQIDPSHSAVTFSVRHLMVSKVRGRFGSFTGTITVGDDLASSSVTASVDTASVDTNDEARDQHLRSGDFFDVERFPAMTFRSTSIEEDGDGYRLTGELTIKDVTRPVVFDVEFGGVSQDPWGNTKAGFDAKTTVNRKDFGLEWNAPLETGGVLLGDKVTIELDVEAALDRQPAVAQA